MKLTTPPTYLVDGVLYPQNLIGPNTHGPDPIGSLRESRVSLNGENYKISESLGPLVLARDASSNDVVDLFSIDPTAEPVQGVIDNVLLPLIFLAVAGPMFVVVYIVMSSIEYKLPPNVQQRSLNNRKHTYFDLLSLYKEGRKFMENDSCLEKLSCEAGGPFLHKMRQIISPTLFDYLEGFTKLLIPPKSAFKKSYDISIKSARGETTSDYCSSLICSF